MQNPSPCRWRQGRCETAGTWRTCQILVQRNQARSFRRGLFEFRTSHVFNGLLGRVPQTPCLMSRAGQLKAMGAGCDFL